MQAFLLLCVLNVCMHGASFLLLIQQAGIKSLVLRKNPCKKEANVFVHPLANVLLPPGPEETGCAEQS